MSESALSAAMQAALAEMARTKARLDEAIRATNDPDWKRMAVPVQPLVTLLLAVARQPEREVFRDQLKATKGYLVEYSLPDLDPELEAVSPSLVALRSALGELALALDRAERVARQEEWPSVLPAVPERTQLTREILPVQAKRVEMLAAEAAETRKAVEASPKATPSEKERALGEINKLDFSAKLLGAELKLAAEGKSLDRVAERWTVGMVERSAKAVWEVVKAGERFGQRAVEQAGKMVRTARRVARHSLALHRVLRLKPALPAPSLSEPSSSFDLDEVYRMLLRGEMPPQAWVPQVVALDLRPASVRGQNSARDYPRPALAFEALRDLSLLRGLTGLRDLRLGTDQFNELTSLSELHRLGKLFLVGEQPKDLSFLAKFVTLRELDLLSMQVAKVPAISELRELEILSLLGTGIRDLRPLAKLWKLYWLSLSRTPVRDLAPLAELSALERIWLNNTQIDDLGPLAKLPKLRDILVDKDRQKTLAQTLPPGRRNIVRIA